MNIPCTDVPSGVALPPPMPAVWAVVELMGHRRIVGRVSEVDLFGRRLGRVESPKPDGSVEVTYFGGSSVYALTEATEEQVRAEVARRSEYLTPLPAHRGYPTVAADPADECREGNCRMPAHPDCDARRCVHHCDERCDTHCERSLGGHDDDFDGDDHGPV